MPNIQLHSMLPYCAVPMIKDDSDRIHELCSRIALEHDRQKFANLVEELNRILAAQDRRLQNKQPCEKKGD